MSRRLTSKVVEVRLVDLPAGVGLLVLRQPPYLDAARGAVHILGALAHVEATLGVAHRQVFVPGEKTTQCLKLEIQKANQSVSVDNSPMVCSVVSTPTKHQRM